MSTPQYKIIFAGQPLPGVDDETARHNLAKLFKSDAAAVDKLFSGRRVALKRNLSRAQADQYLKALHEAGVQVEMEEEAEIQLSLLDVEPQPAPPAEPHASPYAPPRAPVVTAPLPVHELKVFSFQGRLGRLRYVGWMTAAMLLILPAGMVLSMLLSLGSADRTAFLYGMPVILVVPILYTLASIQMGARRLHDIGLSGWWLLLQLLPVVNMLLYAGLILYPGNKGANGYGAPPPANSTAVKILAVLGVLVIAGFFTAGVLTGYTDSVRR